MKKPQLKKIIKEEIQSALRRTDGFGSGIEDGIDVSEDTDRGSQYVIRDELGDVDGDNGLWDYSEMFPRWVRS